MNVQEAEKHASVGISVRIRVSFLLSPLLWDFVLLADSLLHQKSYLTVFSTISKMQEAM